MNNIDSKQIKAIIFDCFGVLVSDRWLRFRQKYFANDSNKLTQASSLRRQADGGNMNRNEFIRHIANLAGISEEEVTAEIDSSLNTTDQDLLAYIAELKINYKIGFLSNASQNYLSRFFTPKQIELFDKVSISCETGFVKPDRQSYESIAEMFDTPIEECLLIDDQLEYCRGAQVAGMQAIQYQGLERLKKDLALFNHQLKI